MSTNVDIGWDTVLQDPPAPLDARTGTDPLFLLHSDAQTRGTFRRAADVKAAYPSASALVAIADAFFGEGGRTLHLVPLTGTAPGDDLAANLQAIGADEGPGQVVAPEVTTTTSAAVLAEWAFTTNRVYIANASDGATDTTLKALGDAIRAANGGGRFACVQGDTVTIPGTGGSGTRDVPGSVVLAALIARSDLASGNPNLAVAGRNAQLSYGLGLKAAPRTRTARGDVAGHGVNSFSVVFGRVRHYAYRSCADPALFPHWWDLGGPRVVMAFKANAAPVTEDFMFPQLDGDGVTLATFAAALGGIAQDLQSLGALFKRGTAPGYRVVCDASNNPIESLARGEVRADVRLRTSPHGEHITTALVKLPITVEV